GLSAGGTSPATSSSKARPACSSPAGGAASSATTVRLTSVFAGRIFGSISSFAPQPSSAPPSGPSSAENRVPSLQLPAAPLPPAPDVAPSPPTPALPALPALPPEPPLPPVCESFPPHAATTKP